MPGSINRTGFMFINCCVTNTPLRDQTLDDVHQAFPNEIIADVGVESCEQTDT